MSRRCPICNKDIPDEIAAEPYRPFCSRRCQQIDLGRWLTGSYAIPASEESEDEDEGGTPKGEPPIH